MTTVYLIRHGEIKGNATDAPQTYGGRADLLLTPRGEQQAAALGPAMQSVHLDAIYTSNLRRTQMTAAAVAQSHQLETIPNGGWDELDFGDWEKLTAAQIAEGWADLWQQWRADPIRVRCPHGESYEGLWKRLHPAWQELLAEHERQSVAVFAHKGSIRILLSHLLGMPLEYFKRVGCDNTGISRVEITSGKPPLIHYINDTSHLR